MPHSIPVICDDGDSLAAAHIPALDAASAARLAEIFKVLSDPTRVRILWYLTDREVCVHTLTGLLDVTQSAVSHQLRLLRERRLVRFRKQGRHVYYTLDDDHVRDMFRQGLLHVEHG